MADRWVTQNLTVEQQVTELYVATFGRAPDATGLAYWVGRVGEYTDGAADGDAGLSINQVAQSFFDQPETQSQYPSGTTNASFVLAVYNNAFGRAPDTAGLNYWVNELDTGAMTRNLFIISVLRGARDDTSTTPATFDNSLVTNQRIAADYYADSTAATSAEFNAAEAAAILVPVTSDASSIAASQTLTNQFAAGTGPATGQTFTLTTTVDAIPGMIGSAAITSTAGDDTINALLDATAANGTLQLTDSINAGTGTNTMMLRVNGAVNVTSTTSPTLNNVQNLTVTNLAGATNVDASVVSSLTTLNSDASLLALTATNLATTTNTLGLSNIAADNADLTGTWKTGLTSASDALKINVTNTSAATVATPANYAEIITNGAAASDGWDLVTINATGTNRLDLVKIWDSAGSSLKTLTVTGDGSLRVNNSLDFLGTAGTVDASANTGGVNLQFGAEDIKATGGSGNDRFAFAAAGDLTAADTINGGGGTNTLAIADATISSSTTTLNTVINGVTSMQKVEFTAATLTAADVSMITMTKDFVISGGTAATVTGAVNTNTFGLSVTNGAVSITPLLDGGNDILNLTVGGSAATTITSVGAATGGWETVNVTTTGTGATAITTLTMSTNGKVDIAGSNAFTTTVVGTNATIDGGDATGALTVSGEAGNNSIIGGTVNDTISGLAGIDTIDLTKGGTDTVRLDVTPTITAADRDIISGFGTGVGGDLLDLTNLGTAVTTFRSITGSSAAFTLVLTDNVVTFDFAVANNSANLAISTNGTELFKGIATQGSSIASLTSSASDTGYLLAYQGGNGYLYYYSDADASSTVTTTEVALIGTLNSVAVGSFVSGNVI